MSVDNNPSVRDEIQEIVVSAIADGIDSYAKIGTFPPSLGFKATEDIIELVASKMPEKKYTFKFSENKNMVSSPLELGYNQALTEVKSILKGGTDESILS